MNTEIEYKGFPIRSKIMLKIFMKVAGFARQGYPLIFFGPSGTGKEYLARYYFQEFIKYCVSPAQFISVNCSNFSEDLAISELFGHVKGAFTGAIMDKKGLFEQIDNGVLFLDEIGDLLPRVQAMLLRALDSDIKLREGKRLGADKSYIISKNVIVICATEQSPEKLRESLLPRLGARVFVPGMDERPEDNHSALNWFLLKAIDIRRDKHEVKEKLLLNSHSGTNYTEKELMVNFAGEATQRLIPLVQAKIWPGNYRTLRNTINEAVILADDFTSLDNFTDNVVNNFCEGLKIYSKSTSHEPLGNFQNKELDFAGQKKSQIWSNQLEHILPEIDDAEKDRISSFLAAHEEIPFKRFEFEDYIGVYSNSRIPQLRLKKLKQGKIICSDGKGKGISYSVNRQNSEKFMMQEPGFLSLPLANRYDSQHIINTVAFSELLEKVKGIHISILNSEQKAGILSDLVMEFQDQRPLYYFSFEKQGIDFLIRSVITAVNKNNTGIPFDEVFKTLSSDDLKIAFLSGYIQKIIDPELQPILILDDVQTLKIIGQHQALLSMLNTWYFLKFILIGEKLENYLEPCNILEYTVLN